MSGEKEQFHTLLRAFWRRFLQNELFSEGGDLREFLANVLALLGALGVCISFLLVSKHVFRMQGVPQHLRDAISWGDQEFLLSTTIAVAGLSVIVCWDALFPDRTDALVLSPLPVRMRAVFAAKVAAVSGVFLSLTAAVNAFPLIVFPLVVAGSTGTHGAPRFFLAQLLSTLGATAFIFLSAAGVQGVLINLLPYRRFRQFSAYVQLAALFGLLAMFFATPDAATPASLADPANRRVIAFLPSFWFLGVYQWILGTDVPEALWLAGLAGKALAAAALVAIGGYAAGYARYVRRTVEGAGMPLPAPAAELGRSAVAARMAPLARERAILLFTWRTLTRSRTHRLILAGYLSLGLAFVLMSISAAPASPFWPGFRKPSPEVGFVPLALSFFAIAGLRGAFAFPVDLKANWLFRFNEIASPEHEMRALRKLIFALVIAPAVSLSLPAYWILWGPACALRQAVMVLLLDLLMVEFATAGFQKVPFTCSMLPGKLNLKGIFGVWLVLFFFLTYLVSYIVAGAVANKKAFLWAAGLALALLVWRIRQRRRAGWSGFVFEDRPDWQPTSLELT